MTPTTPSQKIVYSSNRYSVLAASLLTAMLAASSAQAGDIIKANNTTALNLAGSWTTVAPTANDVAVWNNTVTGNNSVAIGGDLSWQGIRIVNVGGTGNQTGTTAGVQITNASSANTLTLGTAGIDMSAATQALLIQSKVALSGNQTWNIANANTQNAPFAGSGVNSTLGEDLMFTAQAAATMNLGGFTLSTSGVGSLGLTNGYAVSNGVINLGNTNTWFQSGGNRATTLAGNVTVNVAANSNFRLRANSGGVSSAAAIGVSGAGSKLQLEINNSGVTMAQSGALTFGNGSTFENILTANGGMTVGAISATGNVAWNVNGAATAMTNGVAVSGNLTGNGAITYANTSTNNQARLSGNNAGFTGSIDINGASGNRTLRLTTATAGSASGTWSVAAANTLQVDGVAVNLGTLNGAGTVTNSHATNVAAIAVGNGSFSGAITNGTPASGMSLTKNTGGTLTLSGSGNTFTGATNITGGKLVATQTGALSTSSAISVNGSGAIFDGTGTFGAVTVADNLGTVQNGNGGSGALTLSSLTFNGDATLNVVTSSSTPSARVVVTGALTTTSASGTVTVNGSGSWTNGVNNLVSFGSFGGAVSDFTLGTLSGLTARQSAGPLSISGSNLLLSVAGDSPKWTGSDNGDWVVGATGGSGNWQLITAGTPTDFIASDIVLFDDSAPGTKTVNVSAANVSVASAEFNNSSSNYTLTGGFGISAGTIAKSGSGALTIENANTTSGGVQLNAGTLNVNNNSALGSGALAIAADTTLDNTSGSAKVVSNAQNWNGNFTFTGTNDLTVGAAAMSASRDVTVNGGNLTVGGISGTGFGLTKSGIGTLAVGSSSYSGATVVNGGVLKATSTSSFTTTSSIALADTAGVALDLNGNSQAIGTITGGGSTGGNVLLNGAVLTTGTAGNSTFAGALVGAGGLTKTGSGRFTLSGDKSGYTGVTTVSGGTLDLDTVNGSFGSAAVVSGGTATNSITVGSGLFVQGNGLLTTGISGGSAGFGARGGNLTVNVGGSGGMINRNSGGTLGLGQMVFGSATSDSRVVVQNEIGINNNGGTRDITVNIGTGTASAEIAGVISGGTAGGVSGIIKKGNGDLILSNANTYLGNTTIDAGRVVLGHAQALQFSALNTNSVGKVSATGFAAPTLGGLTGSTNLATVIDSGYTGITTLTLSPQTGQSQSYAGVIADGAAGMNVTKTGAGTQTFTATQTYTGGTNVNAGTLALGHATNTLADSGAVAVGGGTLALGANNDTVGAVTLTSGSITGTGTLSGSSYDVRSGTVSAILGGSGGLTKSTAGTVTLSGTNNYSGATVVNGGVLELIGTGSVNNTSGITVDGGLFKNNSSVAITQPFTFTSGTIGGTNLSGVSVSVGTSQTLSPGNSPGTMTTGATTFADGGTYVWEINNATVGGQGTKWDLLVADSLTISAGTAGFTVNIVSLVDSTNVAGNATAFDPEVNSYFLFANTASEIASFSSTAFAVNSSGFSNTFTGTWTIKRGDDATIIGGDNTELYVSYAPIPEPSAYAVLVGLGAIGLTLSRRRRRQHN